MKVKDYERSRAIAIEELKQKVGKLIRQHQQEHGVELTYGELIRFYLDGAQTWTKYLRRSEREEEEQEEIQSKKMTKV